MYVYLRDVNVADVMYTSIIQVLTKFRVAASHHQQLVGLLHVLVQQVTQVQVLSIPLKRNVPSGEERVPVLLELELSVRARQQARHITELSPRLSLPKKAVCLSLTVSIQGGCLCFYRCSNRQLS